MSSYAPSITLFLNSTIERIHLYGLVADAWLGIRSFISDTSMKIKSCLLGIDLLACFSSLLY